MASSSKSVSPTNKASVKEVTREEEPREHIKAPLPPSSEKVKLMEKCGKVITECGGESNIPITHDYWKWKNQVRGL